MTVEVVVDVRADSVIVNVADNGSGGDIGKPSGHGIVGMRERVELINGSFHAGRRSEGGFEVRAVLPIEPEAH